MKDLLLGEFSSKELEKHLNVELIHLGMDYYGWGTAKVKFLLSNKLKGEKVLILDSDIVFAGKLLEYIYSNSQQCDFAVNSEYVDNPTGDYFMKLFYNYSYIKKIDPGFSYPGYCFNSGQMLVSTDKLDDAELIDFLDLKRFPYWKRRDIMPLVDQSLLNYILPKKEQSAQIKISKLNFMKWSELGGKDLSIDDIKSGKLNYLIHWAGAVRTPLLSRMTRTDILTFFQDYYYSLIPYGKFKKQIRHLKVAIAFKILRSKE